MNRTAVVTGANRGLGKAIVGKLAAEGFDIWACVRTETDELNTFLAELSEKNNICAKTVLMDLSSEEGIKTGYRQICAEKRNIDVLINNAGIGHMELFQMTKMSRIQEIYQVNVFAPMQLTQLVLRNMSRQRSGKIINIASTAANEIYEGNSIYGATKAALIAFTQSLAAEVYRNGVTINAVAPGLIDTEMSAVFEGRDPQEPLRHTALGRKILPEEVADVIVEMLSDRMRLINGEVICVNGGHK